MKIMFSDDNSILCRVIRLCSVIHYIALQTQINSYRDYTQSDDFYSNKKQHMRPSHTGIILLDIRLCKMSAYERFGMRDKRVAEPRMRRQVGSPHGCPLPCQLLSEAL